MKVNSIQYTAHWLKKYRLPTKLEAISILVMSLLFLVASLFLLGFVVLARVPEPTPEQEAAFEKKRLERLIETDNVELHRFMQNREKSR